MQVMIVEDHGLLAESLAAALRQEGLAVHVADVRSREGVLAAAGEVEPELVLLDLDLGGLGSGLDLIPALRDAGAHVVMLTGTSDRVRLAECVEAGAIGVVSKSVSFDDLVSAVNDSVSLGRLMTRHQREELLAELRRQRTKDRERLEPFDQLTRREREVLAALLRGKSAEAMASEWYVSMATIRSQIRSVLQKLRVNSQLAAVAKARAAGWDRNRT